MSVRRPIRYLLVAVAGLLINAVFFPQLFATGWAVAMKVSSNGEFCSWSRTLTYYSRLTDFDEIHQRVKSGFQVKEQDEAAQLQKIRSPGLRDLWAPQLETDGGTRDYSWFLAEQEWLAVSNREDYVQPGDVVLDCGARMGIFVAKALQRGAAKVIAIDTDPLYVESLRRNFRTEIAFGRVVLAPVSLSESDGMTIDSLVSSLKLARVHFIRMDLRGKEREALRGAKRTIQHDRPRVMLDLSRRPDDVTVLPGLLRSVHANYRSVCGPCLSDHRQSNSLIPHVVYFR
jgi:hypothetical protein